MKKEAVTVHQLIAMLQQADPAAKVNLQGCDCINPATRIWKPDGKSRSAYAGEIMIGFAEPTSPFITRGFELLAEPPPKSPDQ